MKCILEALGNEGDGAISDFRLDQCINGGAIHWKKSRLTGKHKIRF